MLNASYAHQNSLRPHVCRKTPGWVPTQFVKLIDFIIFTHPSRLISLIFIPSWSGYLCGCSRRFWPLQVSTGALMCIPCCTSVHIAWAPQVLFTFALRCYIGFKSGILASTLIGILECSYFSNSVIWFLNVLFFFPSLDLTIFHHVRTAVDSHYNLNYYTCFL